MSAKNYDIPDPDFIFVAPRGSYVVVVDPKGPKDISHHISALLIECASLLNGQTASQDSEALVGN